VAYRADIEIGVKGQEAIGRLQKQLDGTLYKINKLNSTSVFRTGNVTQNIDRYTKQVDLAARAIDRAAMGTIQETRAITNYVTAMGQANAARARQNYLIEQEIANRRKVQATVNAGFGQQGAALPPSMRNAGFGQQGPALPPRATARAGGGIGKGISGAVSNAAIGGAFPLLFGQSGAAAAGGALGGIAGSFLGPSGGFAGSLVGTILGEKLGQADQVKQLGEDIGFSTEQTKLLATAFNQAGKEFDKFQQSVSTIQGLSLSVEDQARAIQLASSLTETYKGKIDKVTNAFANALSTGKVTQGTLNQLTSQGIPIQQALADKYSVSRDAILKMAKDGKISVQDLIDTLVEVGNKGQASATTQADAFSDAYAKIEPLVKRLETLFEGLFKFISDRLSSTLTEVLGTIDNIITGIETLANFIGPKFDSLAVTVSNSLANIKVPPWLASFMRQGGTDFVLGAIPGGSGLAVLNQVGKDVNKSAGMYGKYIPGSQQQAIKPQLQSLTAPSQAAPSGGKKDNSAEKAAKAAEREAARVANIVRDRAVATEQLRLQMQYSHGLFTAEVAKDEVLKIQLQHAQKYGQISLEYSKQINDEVAKGNSIAAKEAITKEFVAKLQAAQLDETMDLKLAEIKRAENYATIIADLDYELQLKTAVTEQDRIQLQLAYEKAKLEKDNPQFSQKQIDAITQKKTSLAAPKTDRQTIEGRVGQLQDEIKEMTKFSTIAITAADGIGNAFANSFKSLIDGSMSAREALSSFFKDVASMFLDMAAQIIAKQMTMIILQSILKALGAVAGASNVGSNATNFGGAPGVNFNPAAFSMPALAANGAYFSGGVAAFANGGVVGSPTLFKFANGGTTQTGLMGEAGPEAIMPLSRGAGGKLGVNASGLREAMGGAPGMGGSPVLSMSFETTRFGDTDYVSRDQLEAAMAQTRKQASADGAKRGMSMTLDRLQQSPQTRSRVGLR
jgi:tape measure domain-containing protein